LRIDDTDQQRNVERALRPILEGLRWLGIDWDEGPDLGGPCGPYYQSQRSARYRDAVQQLLDCGAAYWDYARSEEIQTQREVARREKRHFVYDRGFMATTEAEHRRYRDEGRQAVVRLKLPREGELVLGDLIRGSVHFEWACEQDQVIQRADGSCLYHLASVVDDHDMQITHVIRAEEHLSNTPRQVFIARSLGFDPPRYAHVPYVAEPGSQEKLSKRKLDRYLRHQGFSKLNEHGQRIAREIGIEVSAEAFNPVVLDFYRKVGYLPEAIVNYLLLLGWSLDDKAEFFARSEMVKRFSLDRVNKAPARFDPQKLEAFQARYMQQLSDEQKTALVLPYLEQADLIPSPPQREASCKVASIVRAAGDRIRVAGDILDYADFFVTDDCLPYEVKAFDKRLRRAPESVRLLTRFRGLLAVAEPFDAPNLEKTLTDFVASEGVKIGQIIHALRVAVTGKSVGFGLFETLEILGPQHCLARIDRALAEVA
jgi:glutamyl-tRNA synthetase